MLGPEQPPEATLFARDSAFFRGKESAHLSRSCKMCILPSLFICLCFGIIPCAVFVPCPTGSRQLPHGHSWQNCCCLTHVQDSVMSLTSAPLLPSPHHILKNPCSILLLRCLVVQKHNMAPFLCAHVMFFLFENTPVGARTKSPSCLQGL